MLSMFAILAQRRLRWLGHVCRMEDGRIPKDILYGELTTGKHPTGRPALSHIDVWKKDLKSRGFNPAELEAETSDRTSLAIKDQGWRQIGGGEEREPGGRTENLQATDSSAVASIPTTGYICSKCHRSFGSRMGLHSHRQQQQAANQNRQPIKTGNPF